MPQAPTPPPGPIKIPLTILTVILIVAIPQVGFLFNISSSLAELNATVKTLVEDQNDNESAIEKLREDFHRHCLEVKDQ
jgi:hypothetical protein